MSVWLKLKLLLWKNCIIRKRHWLLTLIEIAAPVIFYVFQPLVHSDIHRPSYISRTYNPQRSSKDMYRFFNKEFLILYAPFNNCTEMLMKKVTKLLNLDVSNVRSFFTTELLLSYFERIKSTSTKIMAVIFQLTNNENLHYTIKPYETNVNWRLFFKRYLKNTARPGTGSYNYIHHSFLPLQMAIDSSYLNTITNVSINIVMEEFPHPSYKFETIPLFSNIYATFTVVSYIFLFPNVVERIVEDKHTGVKELMKIMGVQWWLLWIGWFLHAFMISIISTFLISIFLKVSIWHGTNAPSQYSSFYMLFLFLLSYNVAAVSFCFAISSMFSNPLLANAVGFITWLASYFYPVLLFERMRFGQTIPTMAFLLLPNTVLFLGYNTIYSLEDRKIGFKWETLSTYPSGLHTDVTMNGVFMMFLLESILYLLLALYLEKLFPGPYGISKPLFFPCKKMYDSLFSRRNQIDIKVSQVKSFCKIEKERILPIGIHISNLSKTFDDATAVSDVSLNIYKNEITVLLGHNGAGKSTIMSIIGGKFSATTGRVIVCGHDVKYDLNKVRKSIGICPQNDLLFTELTVVEHLIFFGRLKKMSKENVYEEALSLLQSFNLHNQKDLFVFQLSSGMRRKLSVIIALIGSPKVLLMDDPTSRLDIESRRLVWDRLLSLKNSRVIILNTQCMEEADMFADRIAILNQGRLMCYGTPAFLKKEYGTRHQLVLNFNRDNAVHHNEITSIVKGIIPRARLHHNDGDSITFLLPQETKLLFPSLLEALEANFDKLHIAHMKFSFSTIEEVYLRINNIMSKSFYQILNDNEYNFKQKHFDVPHKKVAGCEKLISEFMVLFKKRYWIEKRKRCILFIQLLSIILLTLLTLYCSDLRKNMLESLELNFNVYPTSKVYYSLTYTDFKPKLEVVYYNLLSNYTSNIYKVENVREALIQEGQQNIRFYWDHLIVAAEFNKTGAENFVITALYSCNAVHGAPISYLLVLNTAIRAFVNPDASIKCFNSPFPTPFGFDPKVEKFGEHWYIVFSSAILYYSGKFLVFPVTEKVLTTKHLQLMSGLHIFVYWTVCYIWDLIILLIVIIAVLSVIGLYGVYRTCVFCGEDEMTVLFFILMTYGCSIILYSYVVSHLCQDVNNVFFFSFINLFLGIVLSNMMLSLMHSLNFSILYNVLNLLPQYGLCMSLYKFHLQARTKYTCSIELALNKSEAFETCSRAPSYYYGKWAITPNILIMSISILLYLIILYKLETDAYFKWKEKMFSNSYINKPQHSEEEREEVKNESDRVSNIYQVEMKNFGRMLLPYNAPNDLDIMLLHNITKVINYKKIVEHISFGIKQGKCLGILGLNGSGKTTLFRVLTKECLITHGDARICHNDQLFYLSNNLNKYLSMIGYCPQHDPISDYLTARETLYIFGKIRGISYEIDELISMWIELLGLEEISDTLCKHYSKIDKRKLSIGIALIGSPLIVLLDEPTIGMDPESCQNVWNIINFVLKQPNSPCVVIASQNTVECEKLCDNVCIIKTGKIEYFGKLSDLKQKFGKGFIIKLKLNLSLKQYFEKITDSAATLSIISTESISNLFYSIDDKRVIHLMSDIALMYSGLCLLKHTHINSLHYYIEETKKWSEIFTEIEELKKCHPIVEDYQISEHSLDDIFLSVIQRT